MKRNVEDGTIQVSPNPVYDKLRIESKGTFGKEWHVIVIDMNGRLISNNSVSVESSLLIMSTEGWKNGMYQILISDELGNRYAQKILKME